MKQNIPQNIKNAFNVNINFSIQLCKTLVTLSATCCNFFLKIYNSNYFQFYSHSTEKFAILSYTAIFVNSNFSQHHCMWNDILLTNFVLSFHIYSQLSDWKLCLKNREKHSRKVLKSKLSFTKIAFFTGEYLQNNKQLTCKFFKYYFVFTILGNT